MAQATLSAERGTTVLELAERLAGGFRWLLDDCFRTRDGAPRPIDDPVVRDGLARFETELTGLRAISRDLVERADAGTTGPADAPIVKLYYSELLQRLTGFAVDVVGPRRTPSGPSRCRAAGSRAPGCSTSSARGSGTIPGGSSEIQRTIIGERGLGLPQPSVQ